MKGGSWPSMVVNCVCCRGGVWLLLDCCWPPVVLVVGMPPLCWAVALLLSLSLSLWFRVRRG